MTYLSKPTFAVADGQTIPIHLVSSEQFEKWCAALDDAEQNWIKTHGFTGGLGQWVACANTSGGVAFLAIGTGTDAARKRQRFGALANVSKFPSGRYHLALDPEDDVDPAEIEAFALGWLLSSYRFDRYTSKSSQGAELCAPDVIDHRRIEILAAGEFLTRDLINTPAQDMGPSSLQKAFFEVAQAHGARARAVVGQDLLEQNFPMIHAVGRAAADAPRLLDMSWGDAGPLLVLVGKGVCFDTGGLNIKPASSMGLMKKDMGGAATVLGLAHMIMSLGLKLRLRVLVPAVENNIDGGAFRPQDILTSRKGLTVEINNTDAEGRLVLADALALADESEPDVILSMATLTGAARVAVGPDLAPFFTDDEAIASYLAEAAGPAQDPVWRLPFWDPYEAMIEPDVADLDNAPKGGFAGSITAALFLRRFVTRTARYGHFDIYGWQPSAAPGRPKGGTGQGARAVLEALPDILNL
ncbi:leucyl aminopeptidase family protein [Algirhabdus cladophorae]|uniref:leucyl aminopeptidase family protein n=1 Tax=Algirhabdus cladophorae TaxID=3377108 RepID=UPI003B84B3CC